MTCGVGEAAIIHWACKHFAYAGHMHDIYADQFCGGQGRGESWGRGVVEL